MDNWSGFSITVCSEDPNELSDEIRDFLSGTSWNDILSEDNTHVREKHSLEEVTTTAEEPYVYVYNSSYSVNFDEYEELFRAIVNNVELDGFVYLTRNFGDGQGSVTVYGREDDVSAPMNNTKGTPDSPEDYVIDTHQSLWGGSSGTEYSAMCVEREYEARVAIPVLGSAYRISVHKEYLQ